MLSVSIHLYKTMSLGNILAPYKAGVKLRN